MKKKMLYISHVDWNWIKQRPHFIAEGLMEFFDVSVLYTFQNKNRNKLQKRSTEGQDISPFYSIPMAGRIKPLGVVNRAFMKVQLARCIHRVNPDYIYLTYPTQMDYLPKQFSGKIIYDCMDDYVAMALGFQKENIRENESRLIRRAAVVFVSSENLGRVLMERYGRDIAPKLHLIRNGYNGSILPEREPATRSGDFTLCYVGTIGKWFNFDFITRSLQDIPGLRYKIIGPTELEVPRLDRIEYTGTVEHHRLYDEVKDTDALMMPFQVNDIVASVDPVKLYEYINYNMNILCVRYPEVERFEPFVHFYDDYDSFLAQIKKMMTDNTVKYGSEARTQFLQQSNWESRVGDIVKVLENK